MLVVQHVYHNVTNLATKAAYHRDKLFIIMLYNYHHCCELHVYWQSMKTSNAGVFYNVITTLYAFLFEWWTNDLKVNCMGPRSSWANQFLKSGSVVCLVNTRVLHTNKAMGFKAYIRPIKRLHIYSSTDRMPRLPHVNHDENKVARQTTDPDLSNWLSQHHSTRTRTKTTHLQVIIFL